VSRIGEQRGTVGVKHASHRLLTEVPAPALPLVVLVLEHCRGQTQQEVGVGKDAPTFARRSSSALTRSMALVEEIERQWSTGRSR
jgi:hypothetical protein